MIVEKNHEKFASPTVATGTPASESENLIHGWEANSSKFDDDILSSFDPVIEVGHQFSRSLDEESRDLLESLPENTSFDLGDSLRSIPNKLFFRIGEVGELLEVKTYVLRFWETEFSMIQPTKSKTGQRVYRRKDVEMLMLIKHLLYVERFSIEGARKRIREMKKEGGVNPSAVAEAQAAKTQVSVAHAQAVSPAASALSLEKRTELRSRLELLAETASKPISELFKY